MLRAQKLVFENTEFIATHIGHHIESLADETIIANSLLDDADGRSSYAVDISKGGKARITGNKIIQSADAENITMINYDTSRGGKIVAPSALKRYSADVMHRVPAYREEFRRLQPIYYGVMFRPVEWCLNMDIIIAAESARFGGPEVHHGSIQLTRLPYYVGFQQAKKMYLTGDMITGKEAERIGLVTECVPDDKLMEVALKLAKRISKNSSQTIMFNITRILY